MDFCCTRYSIRPRRIVNGIWSATPLTGNTAVFLAAGTKGSSLYNDITGLTLTGITFSSNTAQSAYTINGNAITLNGNIALLREMRALKPLTFP